MAKLGDIICTTPMFRAVKKEYPSSRLFVMGDAVNEKVIAHNPDIDHYLISKAEGIFARIKLLKSLQLDFACVTSPQFEYLASLYLAGVPFIVTPRIENGFCPVETKVYKLLSRLVNTRPHRMKNYAAREYLRLLEPIGIKSEDTKKYIYFSDAADEAVSKILANFTRQENSKLVGISPGAGNKIKQWGGKKFATIAKYLAQELQASIVIIGGKNDLSDIQEMKAVLADEVPYLDLANKINIDELKALINKLDLFISVDTGPIYIAEACGISTIDIVGPVDENEQPPIGARHLIVKNRGEKPPQLFVMNGRLYDRQEALRQINNIETSQVIDAINQLMLGLSNK